MKDQHIATPNLRILRDVEEVALGIVDCNLVSLSAGALKE
jgi:hypothetical protein